MAQETISIGGASGFWGDASHATAQLLNHDGLNFLTYDYLAEITMSLMARMRMKDPQSGYAPDFVSQAIGNNLNAIAEKKVKILSNAGGLNPAACAQAIEALVSKAGLALKVAVVEGDDLSDRISQFSEVKEMFTGEAFPAKPVASVNAYLGAFPIAAALDAGADIVITGRCVDSALPLAACIHAFGWRRDAFDRLAAGALAGHLIECGVQATGGNFTDWELVDDVASIGYPIAIVDRDGACKISKPSGTSGVVTRGTVGEQLLYEIGDPKAYRLPDVTCDFSDVQLEQSGENLVSVSGARGRRPSGLYKVSATYVDGFRAGYVFGFNGRNARQKAQRFAEAGLKRAREKLRAINAADYADTEIEVEGGSPDGSAYEEVLLKTAVRHEDAKAVSLFLKETMGNGLATPPGLNGFTGAGRPKPSPVVRLFSFLVDGGVPQISISMDGNPIDYVDRPITDGEAQTDRPADRAVEPMEAPKGAGPLQSVPLEAVAWGRSGDKGDSANIGLMAREEALMPWIWKAVDGRMLRAVFGGLVDGEIRRYYLPGLPAMNIVMEGALGGGGIASLRNDAQGKGYAQRLLAQSIEVPAELLSAAGIKH